MTGDRRGTAELWESSVERWRGRLVRRAVFGQWLFSSEANHQTRLTAGTASHWFHDLCVAAKVPGGSLHRLRHSVATCLVGRGELLAAQQRLGHRDASTTLRNYAHALPLEDEEVADDIDELLRRPSCELLPPTVTSRGAQDPPGRVRVPVLGR